MNSLARVEVLNTGTELLFGSVINTHLAFLGQQLFPLGLRVERQLTVPDGGAILVFSALTLSVSTVVGSKSTPLAMPPD